MDKNQQETHHRENIALIRCDDIPVVDYLLLTADAPWLKRLRAIRTNASIKSHAEQDEATELDAGNTWPPSAGQ